MIYNEYLSYHIFSVGNVIQVSHVYAAHSLCDVYKISLKVMLKTYPYLLVTY